ncbi:SpoIIE family protein phosphatase [Spirulina subsalsa FACHB-351]|uniref:SpoIIE family protein phosphatase n=1 Tax=Spirulina subsalsa FACHB-351 TaxID=234711 RepID=A0ABT3L3U1_9CYAN|nr:GAF domain-containing SpoIIE family protein phosphatase [Spirulina subsalsa]MCW6036170.1 SpoIIE family protein phosphatase [Spirulina subsalsa FACHB-351]
MTAAPLPPPQSSTSPDSASATKTEADQTPVSALKELVSRLHREQNRIQNLLSSLGFALRSFNNLNQFLEIVPLMAARVTDADGGALVLLKPNGQARLEQLHCQEGHTCQDIRQVLESVTKQMAVEGSHAPVIASYSSGSVKTPDLKAIHFNPSLLDEQLKQSLEDDIQLFGTPILIKNEERGRLYVFSRDEEYIWTTTRKKLVQLVADQTAVAIANHELTNELRKKERLDRELEIAAEIQDHLLPSKCPIVEGVELAASCQTANRVGGDYYDFIPASYEQFDPQERQPAASVPWSIVIGDVMGKGVPAGLIMTMTRGMLRAEVLNRHSPSTIVQHLNQVMYVDLENSHRFLTLFYSEYDPKTRILSYTNAAHNPPLLWHAASHSILKLDTKGMLIGLEPNSEYEDAQIQLESGDTIMYYTDGFTDAVNQEGDRFDEEGLITVFEWCCRQGYRPQALLNQLFKAVKEFSGEDSPRGDDMTVVVMQVL